MDRVEPQVTTTEEVTIDEGQGGAQVEDSLPEEHALLLLWGPVVCLFRTSF